MDTERKVTWQAGWIKVHVDSDKKAENIALEYLRQHMKVEPMNEIEKEMVK